MDVAAQGEKYNVILSPQLRVGYERDLVVQGFAELFKIPESKARQVVGTQRVLKKDIDLEKAKRYQQKLRSIGLEVVLDKVEGDKPAETVAVEPSSPQAPRRNKPVLELLPADESQAADTPKEAALAPGKMICPKCQLEQEKSDQCAGCGVFIHKYIAAQAAQASANPAAPLSVTKDAPAPASEQTDAMFSESLSAKALAFPAVAALVGALLWKIVTVAFGLELGLIAWLIGGMVGFAASMSGARGQNVAIACALLALLAIFGGKYWAVSSLISEATAAVTQGEMLEGVDLQMLYQEMQADAVQFSAVVNDEQSLREFMVQRGYSDAGSAQAVSDEEIDWFRENEQAQLEALLNDSQGFDEWKTQYLMQPLQDLSTFDVVVESLGWLDILFLFLGIGTAYRLGMGEEG